MTTLSGGGHVLDDALVVHCGACVQSFISEDPDVGCASPALRVLGQSSAVVRRRRIFHQFSAGRAVLVTGLTEDTRRSPVAARCSLSA